MDKPSLMKKHLDLQKASFLYNKFKISWILKAAITLLFVYLVNKNLGYDRIRLIEIRLAAIPVVLVFLFGAANFLCQAARWRLVCGGYGILINAACAVKTMLFGNLLAFVTPGKFGELLRGVSIPDVKKADTVVAAAFDKVCAGAVTIVFGACAAVIHGARYGMSAAQTMIVAGTLGLAAVAAVCAVLIATGRAHGLCMRLKLEKAALLVPRLVPKTGAASLWGIAAYSFAAHLLLICQTVCLFAMFGSPDMAASVICSFEAYAFMLFFPFFVANMGIREYSFGLFLGQIDAVRIAVRDVPIVALSSSVSVLAVNMALPALAGLAWWLLESGRRAKGPQPRGG